LKNAINHPFIGIILFTMTEHIYFLMILLSLYFMGKKFQINNKNNQERNYSHPETLTNKENV